MNRTMWLNERRMETFRDVPERFEAKRLSAMDAAELPGMSECSFRRERRRLFGGFDPAFDMGLPFGKAQHFLPEGVHGCLPLPPVGICRGLGGAPVGLRRAAVGVCGGLRSAAVGFGGGLCGAAVRFGGGPVFADPLVEAARHAPAHAGQGEADGEDRTDDRIGVRGELHAVKMARRTGKVNR